MCVKVKQTFDAVLSPVDSNVRKVFALTVQYVRVLGNHELIWSNHMDYQTFLCPHLGGS